MVFLVCLMKIYSGHQLCCLFSNKAFMIYFSSLCCSWQQCCKFHSYCFFFFNLEFLIFRTSQDPHAVGTDWKLCAHLYLLNPAGLSPTIPTQHCCDCIYQCPSAVWIAWRSSCLFMSYPIPVSSATSKSNPSVPAIPLPGTGFFSAPLSVMSG